MRGPLVVKGEADALHENYKIEIKYKSYSKQFFFHSSFHCFLSFVFWFQVLNLSPWIFLQQIKEQENLKIQ